MFRHSITRTGILFSQLGLVAQFESKGCVLQDSRETKRCWRLIFRVFIDSLLALLTLLALFKFQEINVFVETELARVLKSFGVPAQSSFFITSHIYNHILSIYYYQPHSDQLTLFIQRLSFSKHACPLPLQRSCRPAPGLAWLG